MVYDIAVIGGGPAGLAAAIHGRARNKSVVVVSNEPTASPLCRAEVVDNYPGLPHVGGRALVEALVAQARELGAELRPGRVLNVMSLNGTQYLNVGSDVLEARKLILAPGVVRSARLPGEEKLLGRGVSYCATCDGMLYRGKTVAVAGDVPDLEEEIAFLEGVGCQVLRVPLGGLEILGETGVTAVRSRGEELPCQGVFLLRASLAPTDLVPGLALAGKHVAVDRYMATNLPGIFAAGDCTGAPLQLAKAVGEGQMAAHSAITEIDREDREQKEGR